MYILTTSTVERAYTFISDRTHKCIAKNYAHCNDGASLFYFNGHEYKYVGYFSKNQLVKASK